MIGTLPMQRGQAFDRSPVPSERTIVCDVGRLLLSFANELQVQTMSFLFPLFVPSFLDSNGPRVPLLLPLDFRYVAARLIILQLRFPSPRGTVQYTMFIANVSLTRVAI